MSSKEDLEKMTVAQIREKLKSRKLPISGTKSELINRLHDSLVAEEKLLDDAGPGGDNIDLTDVNVDEVLGLDDEKDSANSEPKPNESLLSLISMESASTRKSNSPKKPILSPEKEPQAANIETKQPEQSKNTNTKSDGQNVEDVSGKNKGMQEAEKKVQLKMAARLGVPLGESEAKAKRAQRFGAGAEKTTKPDSEEMKAKRAERFGLPTEEKSVKKTGTTEEDGMMLKRAERFGLPLKRGAAAEAGSADANKDEVLQKRAKRFGLAGEVEDTKKTARAKRFGMAS